MLTGAFAIGFLPHWVELMPHLGCPDYIQGPRGRQGWYKLTLTGRTSPGVAVEGRRVGEARDLVCRSLNKMPKQWWLWVIGVEVDKLFSQAISPVIISATALAPLWSNPLARRLAMAMVYFLSFLVTSGARDLVGLPPSLETTPMVV